MTKMCVLAMSPPHRGTFALEHIAVWHCGDWSYFWQRALGPRDLFRSVAKYGLYSQWTDSAPYSLRVFLLAFVALRAVAEVDGILIAPALTLIIGATHHGDGMPAMQWVI